MRYLFLIFVLLGLFAITSCDQEVNPSEEPIELDCVGFSKSELESVGTLHNQLVIEAYEKVDFLSCENCIDEVITAFSEIEIDLTGIDLSKNVIIEEAVLLYQNLSEIHFDLRNWSDSLPFSPESYQYLIILMEEIDAMENFYNFEVAMDYLQLVIEADNSLNCFDVELLTGTIEVAKNSAYLWTPVEHGGLNLYSIPHEGSTQSRVSWNWRRAVKGDVSASASYFLGMGIGLAAGLLTPGTNAGIIGMWAIGAGITSALAGLE